MSTEIENGQAAQMPDSELRNIVEAVLLVADMPLPVAKLLGLFPEDAQPTREEIEVALEELREMYRERVIELRKIGNGYRFQTRERYAPWLRKLYESRPPRFSRALLETLAIIAYRQPVTRGEIEEIRGVSVSSDIVQRLLEREWIRQVGVRDVPGHPALFGTTKEFLAYFNLTALRDLPALMAQRDLSEIAQEMKLELPAEVQADEEESGLEVSENTGEAVSEEAEVGAVLSEQSFEQVPLPQEIPLAEDSSEEHQTEKPEPDGMETASRTQEN